MSTQLLKNNNLLTNSDGAIVGLINEDFFIFKKVDENKYVNTNVPLNFSREYLKNPDWVLLNNPEKLFVHDCSRCELVSGQHLVEIEKDLYKIYDFYICKDLIEGFTPLARFSDEGPDYNSGKCFIGSSVPLTILFKTAVEKGVFNKLDISVDDILNSEKYKNFNWTLTTQFHI